jgi:hypothetical protein
MLFFMFHLNAADNVPMCIITKRIQTLVQKVICNTNTTNKLGEMNPARLGNHSSLSSSSDPKSSTTGMLSSVTTSLMILPPNCDCNADCNFWVLFPLPVLATSPMICLIRSRTSLDSDSDRFAHASSVHRSTCALNLVAVPLFTPMDLAVTLSPTLPVLGVYTPRSDRR